MNKAIFLIVCFILIISGTLTGQVIDIYKCIDGVLQKSNTIRSSQKELENYGKQKFSNLASFIPQISTYASATYDIDENQIGEQGLTVSEKLSLLDNRFSYISYYNTAIKRKELELKSTIQNEILSTIELYTKLLGFKETLQLYRNTKKQYQNELSYIDELVSGGSRTQLDRLSIQIELKNLELKINKLNRDLAVNLVKLTDATGLQVNSINDIANLEKDNIKEVDSYENKEVGSYENKEVDSYENLALENHLAIRTQNFSGKLSKIDKWISFKNLLPDLNLRGYYTKSKRDYWKDSNQIYDYEGNYISRDINQEYWEVSLNLNLEIGSWLRNFANYKIAANNYKREMYNMDDLLKSVNIDLINKRADLEYYREELMLNTEKKELAEAKYRLAQERFRSGLINFLDYNAAQNEILDTNSALINSRNSYVMSLAAWQAANDQQILGKY